MPQDAKMFPKPDLLQHVTLWRGPRRRAAIPCGSSWRGQPDREPPAPPMPWDTHQAPRKDTDGSVLRPERLHTEPGASAQVTLGDGQQRKPGASPRMTIPRYVARLRGMVTATAAPTLLQAR